jgi:hypothetical protein
MWRYVQAERASIESGSGVVPLLPLSAIVCQHRLFDSRIETKLEQSEGSAGSSHCLRRTRFSTAGVSLRGGGPRRVGGEGGKAGPDAGRVQTAPASPRSSGPLATVDGPARSLPARSLPARVAALDIVVVVATRGREVRDGQAGVPLLQVVRGRCGTTHRGISAAFSLQPSR